MPHSATPQPLRDSWSIPRLGLLTALVLGAALADASASPTDYSRESRRFEIAMRDEDRGVRDRAIERFAGLADPRIVPDLVEEAARRLERCRELDRLEAKLVSNLDDLERRSAHARTRQLAATNPSRAAAAASRERDLRRQLDDLRGEREGHRSTHRRAIRRAAVALDSLDGDARTDALAALDRAARDRRRPERAVSAIEVLGYATFEDACSTLTALAANDRDEIRSAAVRACANRCVSETGTTSIDSALRAALDDADWTIRATAIEAIANRADPDTIEALTEVANREPGRLSEDAAAALEFVTRSTPDRSGTEATEAVPRTAHRYGASFYGISTCSRRLVIVLDTSGSMDERAATGDSSKLEVAKRELVRTLHELREPAAFNLVFFGDVVTTWRPDLVAIDTQTRADAIAFTEAVEASGGTNLSGALRAAFAAGENDGPAGGVDTIFVLSDGRPNRGDRLEPDEILRDIVHRHPERRVRIHTIGLGDEHNVELMKGLAEQTGGCYIVRR